MLDLKIFGERLHRQRRLRDCPLREVAELLGVSVAQMSDMEKGKTGTSLAHLVELAEFYHVSTDYRLGITDDPAWRGE